MPIKALNIDAYLEQVDEKKRAALQQLRETILRIVPDAEECISYGIPGFRKGKVFAGFMAAKNHLSYFPHSGRVTEILKEELADYDCSGGTVRFTVDTPLPESLVRKLIETRMAEDRFEAAK